MRWSGKVDRVAGRIYNRSLAVLLGGCAIGFVLAGFLIVYFSGSLSGLVSVAGGIGFGLLARWLWRSRTTLSETMDGHS